jgi:hypothetical protein
VLFQRKVTKNNAINQIILKKNEKIFLKAQVK